MRSRSALIPFLLLAFAPITAPAEDTAVVIKESVNWTRIGLLLVAAAPVFAYIYWPRRKESDKIPAVPALAPAPTLPTPPPLTAAPSLAAPPPISGPVSEAASASGALKGQYEIRREIGRGGMGLVYEAYDKKLDRKVAIKVLRDGLLSDPSERERFLAEARIISHLTHPHIVGICDICTEDGAVRLVFDYVDGRTLSALIAEKKTLSLAECKKVFGQVCEAIQFAHERNVLHRDLKPSNIMIDQNGCAKVMDFGLSREAKDRLSEQTPVDASGTPLHMAPEQHIGKGGTASDVYSLGVCLYEALTGEPPFQGSDLLACKQRAEYVPPSARVVGLSKKVDKFIDMLLAPDSSKRIASAKGMGLILAGL
ncbi:MAG TPA: hypothetical protein DCM05_01475 [Elusimicrobia bacterium]|nr:hypothetical protein [Elusimicrobiota bacterium]